MDSAPTKLEYYTDMLKLRSSATVLSFFKVLVAVLPYGDASDLCGGSLPDYIPQNSTPRILKFGDNPGCPCGGTHVDDISEIISMKWKTQLIKLTLPEIFSLFISERFTVDGYSPYILDRAYLIRFDKTVRTIRTIALRRPPHPTIGDSIFEELEDYYGCARVCFPSNVVR
ncbi:hypothetical protein CRG98_014578 [Punica granatum]|uniref:Threonyl/alanyl tRNA synthetase SAD domain-containing protein n=1 Tax=Punica granatum TaxID=22663 RepID=A0A2I0K993_PUNGR|nr:hypothetical protein CRG98_014578 [Punica granatum]